MSEPTNADILLALGRVEGKVDSFLQSLARQDSEIAELRKGMNAQGRKVAWLSGAGIVLSTSLTLLAGKFLGFLKL